MYVPNNNPSYTAHATTQRYGPTGGNGDDPGASARSGTEPDDVVFSSEITEERVEKPAEAGGLSRVRRAAVFRSDAARGTVVTEFVACTLIS
jgi:hypothetical protein